MRRGLALMSGIGLLLCLSACSSPTVVIDNKSHEPVSVEIQSDVGERYTVEVPTNASARVEISGRDKALWIVARFPDGRRLESARRYVSSQGEVTGSITDERIDIRYEL